MEATKNPHAFFEKVRNLYSHRDEKSRDELLLKDGRTFDRYSAPLIDSKGQMRGRIWYFRNITERKAAEARIQYLAYYDALTGLPNRRLLEDRLSKALGRARRTRKRVALLYLDLDSFKLINDSLGHTIGDVLLKEVAERINGCIRDGDTAARVGGDEFVIALSDLSEARDAIRTAQRIVAAIAERFMIEGHALSTSCSVGVSLFPDHGAECATLIKYADQAMSAAKANGRNTFRVFSGEMNRQAAERLHLDGELRAALDKKEFFLEYQPQMEITSRKITGFEALIRWRHPNLGLVPPDKFIPIAEINGLILPIGEWVLKTACMRAQKWLEDGCLNGPMAVNVSAVQFRQGGFCELVKRVLLETGLPAQYLELELTESLLLSNANLVAPVLQELREMGVKLALDDFGTGYSSLSYLKQFRVNRLKIDRSFVRDIATDPGDAAIAVAIISLAKSLNLKVIAEGVEDGTQLAFLREHGCDAIQGYYLSKPLLGDEMETLLTRFQDFRELCGNSITIHPANSFPQSGQAAPRKQQAEKDFILSPSSRFVN